MTTRTSFLAAVFVVLACADAVAADLVLNKIRFGDQGDNTRVVLEFNGKAKPKGRVSVADDKVIIELDGAVSANKVDVSGKGALVASHTLRTNANGAPVLVVVTREPARLVASPSVLGNDKKTGHRLYFDLQRDSAAAPPPASAAAPTSAAPAAASAPPPSPELLAAAKDGSVEAQMMLASTLARQAKPDMAGALKWYTAAAESGNGPAAYNVAQYTRLGLGVAANPSVAFRWYERAAALNFPPAQVALAIQLIEGQVVPADLERAHFLLQQAASAGEPQARLILEKLEQR